MEKLKEAILEILPHLDEKQKRLYLGSEAKKIGRGGTSLISRLANVSRPTIIQGQNELKAAKTSLPELKRRVRVKGGGRKKNTIKNPLLLLALDSLIEPDAKGDPESPLRWTCKSTRTLETELKSQGFSVGRTLIGQLLTELNYSLQSNSKGIENDQHQDRDEQFKYINKRAKYFLSKKLPVISVDTKKKELVGNYKNAGKEYRHEKDPRKVQGHDFGQEKAVPYGVFDIGENTGFVNVGTNSDTGEFAVASIRSWWNCIGKSCYPKANRLLINADGGGSNGYRLKLWKKELQNFANETNLEITVCHFPPGTSKWNKIEHRLFSYITLNWRGIPLVDFETVVNLIAAVKTKTGLKVKSKLDENIYEKGLTVSQEEMNEIKIKKHKFHGEWNYTISSNM